MTLLIRNNPYPHAAAASTANRLIAWQYEQVNNATHYFSLRNENQELQAENTALREQLERLQTLHRDSLASTCASALMRSYKFIPARIIHAQTRSSHNYFTINRGTIDGVMTGQGVICAQGAVGIVVDADDHYALVMPLIHTSSNLSCAFTKNDYHCHLTWDGTDYRHAQLQDVALHLGVTQGDTIVTSGLTTAFPQGIPVGVIEYSELKKGDSYYTIDVKMTTDFRRVRNVEVVQNPALTDIKHVQPKNQQQ